uniref:NAD(P)H-quinone oxidoreductase subunit 5, chloroplastic n=2 Tax=Physena TaxID=63762 RepID=A0A411JV13_9CARY|nr:NADH-plastoquinone oxidoreductase subunit 5 [Physena sessiliflora]YP_009568926.1 NADH-plastoquinone oxidoreductase subunit 5 [Physena sessiliflora]YP_009569420.1 NADH-plastoquinone oxidoreductase subunit 5 [Physena madagascariensis]YP_009569431.1 NADH-plastoquinone oxidoreductase subunit 5 [Physena madagascariensis]QBC68864.1 NADH-plastoquinone oxidoreductase subunit 5 [Physena madagascariensis]QBC68865.1 NADH-plastoquinone oxidoreductase subunit 5 [Physena madagascariensis]QBC68940.1 NADH
MEHIYQYAWIIPFIPLPVPLFIGMGLLLFPMATKSLRRMWSFPSIFLLSIVMLFSIKLSIHQINSGSIYQYIWSWTINNDFSLDFGYLIDPLTSIMLMLITTVAIMVLIYSDNYMSHDQGYLRFFAYMTFFNTSMLGLVTSSNLIQIYIFWELVGMCSYLLIGFWFTRPIAANACQKAFVTNRVGDFGLLLGILGIYWITGSFEFRDLFEIFNNLILNNKVHFFFCIICTFLLFTGAVAKSAQFPLHLWLPNAMEGPTPISALIHAATMVAAGIFLVARLLPLFLVIPNIMNLISLIGIITVLLGATLALAQKDIKRGLAYSTMSQLGYMMLALGMGSYRAALFHLITHAYSKALLFLGSGSIIHSMEALVGYSPDKSQNMILMGGLRKHVPITKISFLIGTLSLCGIPPLSCFWSKDEILSDSWLYSPIFAIIACSTAGLTAFYMFRIYLLTFEGHFNVYFKNFSGKKSISFYSISLWGTDELNPIETNTNSLINTKFCFLTLNNNEKVSFPSKIPDPIDGNGMRSFITITFFDNKNNKSIYSYPSESDNTMLFTLFLLILFTLFSGSIGIPFDQKAIDFDILSKWLSPSINLLHQNSSNFVNWYEFLENTRFSFSIASFGLFIASFLYKPLYSSLQNFDLKNLIYFCINNCTQIQKKVFCTKIISFVFVSKFLYSFFSKISHNHINIDETSFIRSIIFMVDLISFFDKRLFTPITHCFPIIIFFGGEGLTYIGRGRLSSYLLFLIFFCILIIHFCC